MRRSGWMARRAVAWSCVGVVGLAVACISVATAEPNRKGDALAELGRRLFFDPAVSRSGDNSCASCHDPAHGFASDRRYDSDDFTLTKRHTQSLVDLHASGRFHWDGEFESVEALVTARLGVPTGARARKHGEPAKETTKARGDGDSGASSRSDGVTPAPNPPPAPPPPPPAAPPPPSEDPNARPASGYGSGSGAPSYGNTQVSSSCARFNRPAGSVTGGIRDPHDESPPPEAGMDSAAPPSESASGSSAAPAGGAAEPNPANEPAPPSAEPSRDGSAPSGPYTPPGEGAKPASADGMPEDEASGGGKDAGGDEPSDEPATHSLPTDSGSKTSSKDGGTRWSSGTASQGPSHKSDPTSSRKIDARSVAERVEADGRYAEAFRAAFGSEQVSTARLAKAIAAFVATIETTESAYDRYAAGDADALTASQRRGLALFQGRAGCAQCHVTRGPRAAFSDHEFHNTGIAARSAAVRPTTPTRGAAPLPYDLGRGSMSHSPDERGSFKTPSLRDVTLRGPFMHDGSMRSLEQVVRHYARGGYADENLDPRIHRFAATNDDVDDLVAFLGALSGDIRPALALDHGGRAARTTLRFVDAFGRPVVGMPVTLDPVGDALPGDVPIASPTLSLVTDDKGRVAYVPGRRTHMRLSIPKGIDLEQGGWIPDTCHDRTIELPIRGRVTVLVSARAGTALPSVLVANAEVRGLSVADRDILAAYAPTTLSALRHRVGALHQDGRVDLLGRTLARYAMWIPADAPEDVLLDLPTATGTTTRPVELAPGREIRLDLE